MNKDESRQLRYARGNRAQQFEQSQVMQNADVQQLAKQPAAQQPQMERPAPQPMPEAKPPGMMPPPTTVAPGAGPQPTLPPAKPGEPAAAVPPMPDGAAAMNAEQKAIQKLGRLSLSVDFPTQGHVHHFQKAKANAVLEVSFSDPKIGKRWMRIGIFAGLALLLALTGRIVSARRAA